MLDGARVQGNGGSYQALNAQPQTACDAAQLGSQWTAANKPQHAEGLDLNP